MSPDAPDLVGAPNDAGALHHSSGTKTVEVLTTAPYVVTIGRGLSAQLAAAVTAGGTTAAALIYPEALRKRVIPLSTALADLGVEVRTIALANGENAKTLAALEHCWSEFADAGLDRTGVVIGFGGGAITDIAGFAAATWMRGVRVVQVPTTVLGMVDAAVGGKTGINTAAGKNMVGAFHEPSAVIADLDLLASLPATDLRAGLGEIVKCGFIGDPAILELIEADPSAAADPASDALAELIQRGVAIKAEVVGADLRESDRREILNYGHTLGHAIEKREQYRWRHGDAVSVGMVFAAELARAAGRLDDMTADRHRAVLDLLGLPTSYDPAALDDLIELMGADKKTRHGMLRFVVLDGLARPARFEGPERDLLRQAYGAMCGGAGPGASYSGKSQ